MDYAKISGHPFRLTHFFDIKVPKTGGGKKKSPQP
jgi:hypothetical protein